MSSQNNLLKMIDITFQRYQDKIAVAYRGLSDICFTYNQIEKMSIIVGEHLEGDETLVGIQIDSKSSDLVFVPIFMISCLKFKIPFVYLSLCQNQTEGRVSLISKCSKIIRRATSRDVLKFFLPPFSEYWCITSSTSHHSFVHRHWLVDCIYLVQTSGTTSFDVGGGVVVGVTEDSIMPNVLDLSREYAITHKDIILAVSPPSFDPFYVDLLMAFISGASLLYVNVLMEAKHLAEIFWRQSTICQITPTLFTMILMSETFSDTAFISLRILALGGETFPGKCMKTSVKMLSNLLAKGIAIYNLYGVTEMSCWQSAFHITSESDLSNEQGVPILNLEEASILSATQIELVLDEIVISSTSRYCYIDGNVNRTYNTGDIGVIKKGFLFISGRKNHDFVKVHGKRFSLLDIEQRLGLELKTRCVCVKETNLFHIIFVLETPELRTLNLSQNELLDRARSVLPESVMLPRKIFLVANLILTPNGKLDKREMFKLYKDQQIRRPLAVETELRRLWNLYSGKNSEDIRRKFVDDGGDSFMAVLLSSSIFEMFPTTKSVGELTDLILNATFQDVFAFVMENSFKLLQTTSAFSNRFISSGYFASRGYSNLCGAQNRINIDDGFGIITIGWKFDLEKCIDASPLLAVVDTTTIIVVGSHKGIVICVDPVKIVILWKQQLGDRIESSAAVSQNSERIFLGCYDHYLYCLSLKCGSVLWKFRTGDIIKCSPVCTSFNVHFGSYDHFVYCLNQTNGHCQWRASFTHASITASPIISGQFLIYAALNGTLACFNDEKLDWKVSLSGPVFSTPVLFSDLHVMAVASANGILFVVSLTNGNIISQYTTEGAIFSSLVAYNNRCIFGCHDGRIYCVEITVKDDIQLIWKSQGGGASIYATPFVTSDYDGRFYAVAIAVDATIIVADVDTGRIVYRQQMTELNGQIFSSPVLWNSQLIVGCRDNYLYGFNIYSKDK